MALVGKVGRRRPRARLAMAILYAVLIVGIVTTIYPFLMMLTTGFKGPTDQHDNRLIPKFWTSEDALFEKYLNDKYAGDLELIASTRMGGEATPGEVEAYAQFLESLPTGRYQAGFRNQPTGATSRLNLMYQDWLRAKYGEIVDLNAAYNELNSAFRSVAPPNEPLDRVGWEPPDSQKWADWVEFKADLPAEFRLPIREQRIWQEWLRSQHQGQLELVPSNLRGDAEAFAEIELPITQAPEYQEFRRTALPENLRGESVEEMFGDVLPIVAHERAQVESNSGALKREFSIRNYRYVLDYVLLHGRAIWVTTIFCLLAITTQLFVNPLAAYALSRFPIRASAQILLFLLATMAFPAEVAMIPAFLLLKDLNLLNTFAALVLPTAASGYMIFLLKGFFDSLPREVFESAQIDGASEWKMYWTMALPLSKPVLGYLALLAFMGAYGAFMYAFLVAQDRDMWTLMVWIYQLQQSAPKATVMAAVTLAAIPTLIVFLLAQRVIMQGIVLPEER